MAFNRRHPAIVVAALGLALGSTGMLFTAASNAVQPSADVVASGSITKSSTQVEQGLSLFLEGCSSCHGLAGQGGTDGPSLIGVGAAAVDFQVSSGRMPLAGPGVQAKAGPAWYNEAETAAMAAFVATLGPGPAIPTEEMLDTTGADLALGGELYRTNCAQCHSVSGKGGALSEGRYAPSLMGADAKEIYEAMITGPQSMPVFNDKTLPMEDKQDIIAYINELQKQQSPGGAALGRLGPVTEGLFLFVAGLGALLVVAVWIGAKAK